MIRGFFVLTVASFVLQDNFVYLDLENCLLATTKQ